MEISMPKQGIELGTFCSRERCLNRSATAPLILVIIIFIDFAYFFLVLENESNECGHTKGAVAFNEDSGFWLITSVPKYPPRASTGYTYPHTGCMYGQMFMCVTFNSSAMDNISLQLRYNDPNVYDSNLPEAWQEIYPNVYKLLNGEILIKSNIFLIGFLL